MFLSNRDIQWAIDRQQLIVDPRPESFGAGYDETSIDLHLDCLEEAKIWDIDAYAREVQKAGALGPELSFSDFKYGEFSSRYLIDPPEEAQDETTRATQLVCR
jgi:hypothetical protein